MRYPYKVKAHGRYWPPGADVPSGADVPVEVPGGVRVKAQGVSKRDAKRAARQAAVQPGGRDDEGQAAGEATGADTGRAG